MEPFMLTERVQYPLWDYGWFELARFGVDPPGPGWGSAAEVLAAFVKDRMFGVSLCGGPGWGEVPNMHGPFEPSEFDPAWYQPADRRAVQAAVEEALLFDGELPPEPGQRVPVDQWVAHHTEAGDELFVLRAPEPPVGRWEC